LSSTRVPLRSVALVSWATDAGDKQRLSHEHEFVRGLSLAVSLDLRRSPRNMEGEVGWWWLRIRGGYRLG